MPYDFLDTIKDNLKRDIDLNLNPLKRQAELDYDFTIPNNNIQNKISFLLLLAAACFNFS
jgi:hypothetical protein